MEGPVDVVVAGDKDQGVLLPHLELRPRAGEGLLAPDDGDHRGPGPPPQVEAAERLADGPAALAYKISFGRACRQ